MALADNSLDTLFSPEVCLKEVPKSEASVAHSGTMASLGHTRAVARVFGVRLTGFLAWWLRRTYYLFQMPRWDRRVRIVLDWTVALFFRPDITRVELRVEQEQVRQERQLVTGSARF